MTGIKSVHANNRLLFEKYLEEAEEFWDINLQIKLRKNAQLMPSARWAVNETTIDRITIEYCLELLTVFPDWAIKVLAFHEICHVKQALEGLPLISYDMENENVQKMRKGDSTIQLKEKFNIYELDIQKLSRELNVERKDAEMLLWIVYIMATDFLVNSELITASPVGFENIKVGIVTLKGTQDLLNNPSTRLGAIMESGLWYATIRNVGSAAHSSLAKALVERIQSFEETACTSYRLSTKSYQSYLSALSLVKFTTKSEDFLCMIEEIIRTIIPIMKETSSILEAGFLDRRGKR